MCWIAPRPGRSASVNVSPALMPTDGETFHPLPRSRAALAPVPSVAWPPRALLAGEVWRVRRRAASALPVVELSGLTHAPRAARQARGLADARGEPAERSRLGGARRNA